MAKWSQSSDLEAQGSSLAHCLVSIDKELYSTLSLCTQAYKWVPTTYWGGGGNPVMDRPLACVRLFYLFTFYTVPVINNQ